MSLAEALGAAEGRYDRVEAAYEGMTASDRETFRESVKDPTYSHAQLAAALRAIGYDVDRKQVQHFREKVSLGKVEL